MLLKNKKVFVAMSGGVDSSVAAALMKKANFKVVGVFMKPPSYAEGFGGHSGLCNWKEEREFALRAAAKLDIPLLTWDFSKEYEKHVARYMIEGYKNGITPNPDVMCNKFIKFGLFLDKALKLGADYIATGHYVRIKPQRGPVPPHPRRTHYHSVRRGSPSRATPFGFSLHVAKDKNKDQSYFLYTLTQEQLRHCLFPIGDYKKDEVRKMAKKFGLPNWDKKDSQGICFVGPLEVREFLKRYIRPKKGLVLRKSDGKILGEHDGAWFYTIGQRHGFNLNGGQAYYVVGKNIENNVLYVDTGFENPKSEILNPKQIPNSKFQVKEFNWINGWKNHLPLNCKVKIRYRQKDIDSMITKNGSDLVYAEIKESNMPIAPGQAAVFYKGNEVLGGGIIQ